MSDFIPAPEGFVIDGHRVIGFGSVSKGQLYWNGLQVDCWPCGSMSKGRYLILEPPVRRATNHTCTVSVEDIYGKLPEIPEGYEEVGLSVNALDGATHWLSYEGETYCHHRTYPGAILWLKKVTA